MPATNMNGDAAVPANPSTGTFVVMSPFSGPKGSPFDAKSANGYGANNVPVRVAEPTNYSTGALSTGIGQSCLKFNRAIYAAEAGYIFGYIPGVTQFGLTDAVDSRMLAIGGGRSNHAVGTGPGGNGYPAHESPSIPVPYVALMLLGFGNGGSRDAGAGPAFTGFGMKLVAAGQSTANGAVLSTGSINRSGATVASGDRGYGSDAAASPAVA